MCNTIDLFMITNVMCYLCLFVGLSGLFKMMKYSFKDNIRLSSNIISTITCKKFVYTYIFISKPLAIRNLCEYYIYDLIVSICIGDITMILHHICTLYIISICYDNPHYNIISILLSSIKLGDIFMHHYKILSLIYPKIKNYNIINENFINIWQYFSVIYTIIAWIIFRFLYICYAMYIHNFSITYNIIGVLFIIANWLVFKKYIYILNNKINKLD